MNNNVKIDVLINNNAIILITPPLRRGNVYFSITPPHRNHLQIHPIQIKSNNNISNTYLYPIQIIPNFNNNFIHPLNHIISKMQGYASINA